MAQRYGANNESRTRAAASRLPGDFLIAPDSRVVACEYGEHADDQWSVDDVLRLSVSQ